MENSINVTDHLDQVTEIDRRQKERRQVAIKMIEDYKALAMTQQRSERESFKHDERKKQAEARQLVIRLRKDRKEVQDRSRRKLQDNLERNTMRIKFKETEL